MYDISVETLLNLSFVVLWLLAVLATFIPVVPAGFIIVGLAVLHQLFSSQHEITVTIWVLLAVLVVLSSLLDNVAAALGAKRYGGSKWGVGGALVGGVAGVFIYPPWGMFLLPLLGAFVGELLAGRKQNEALEGAWGAFLGLLGGLFGKAIVHTIMGLLVMWAIF